MLDNGYSGDSMEVLKIASNAELLQKWLQGKDQAPVSAEMSKKLPQTLRFNAARQLFSTLLLNIPEEMRGSLAEKVQKTAERHDTLAYTYLQAVKAGDAAVKNKMDESMNELLAQLEALNKNLADFMIKDGSDSSLSDSAELSSFVLDSYVNLKNPVIQNQADLESGLKRA